VNLQHSAAWSSRKNEEIIALRTQAIDKAKRDYVQRRTTA
jgi:hypothetical protein